jgi:hypothetical protein
MISNDEKAPDTLTMIPKLSDKPPITDLHLQKLRKYPAHFNPMIVKSDSIGKPTKSSQNTDSTSDNGRIPAPIVHVFNSQ